ncbi:Scarecrow-like protein 23 [Apostasia shenzhenica]|uniref:Scarecrow-like protein 23 n=1 Tax=Apostasia shenzhenica TaxID=1088818 RepID=A0A2I0AMS2_9ASPA|nr:Scarecrow-like protein 23 [Apostasia shenzhenica]
MQLEEGEDLLSLSLSVSSSRKRKRSIDQKPFDGSHILLLLQARDRMIKLDGRRQRYQEGDGRGLHLVRLLLVSAVAVDRRDHRAAAQSLLELYRTACLSGDPIHRVAAYFADGLFARLSPAHSPAPGPSPEEEFSAFTALYSASPFYQFAHFTANQAIVEAFEAEESFNAGVLHVVDFDVTYGFQWPSLIQSLSDKASSNNKPITLRITGFGRSPAELQETATRLRSFAAGFRNLSFEFKGKLRGAKFDPTQITAGGTATVVVNLVFFLQKLRSHAEVRSTLAAARELNPSLVMLIEREAGGNPAGFAGSGYLGRFMDCLHYFAAMFDSLNDCLPAESSERLRIEKNHLGWEIMRSVTMADGEEIMRTKKGAMERNGFEGVRLSSRSVSQAKLLLKIKSHCSAMDEHGGGGGGFRVCERDDGRAMSLGWQERRLITATAWRCAP